MTGPVSFKRTWGAEPLGDGTAHLRFWAPAQKSISVRTPNGDRPMKRDDDGWFDLVTEEIAIDDPYSFVLGDRTAVPDPAARAQIADVHGPSRLVDPAAYRWRHRDWVGRPWEEAVIYELHVGAFSEAGTFAGVEERLDHLVDLQATAVELMPVAQFSGNRGWGYDGVLPYAPHRAYGRPHDLKALVDAAHDRGLMILLDVVYNHFGPDGNYLHLYAPDFFDPRRQTPWGAAIAYDQAPVRAFFRDNALYWLEEFRFDGLRFDAIDQIDDPSDEPILDEIARTIRDRIRDRQIHLTTEDSRNIVRLHRRDERGRPRLFTAEWNDDFHNSAHAIATGESEGYYRDFATDHWRKLARALAEGYVYQGQVSAHFGGRPRGEPSAELPPVAFINFLQNHDQVGNRALGERLPDLTDRRTVELLTALMLLCPAIPLLFMGEEWGERRPFCYFTDFHGELAEAVREGRRREFSAWSAFSAPESLARIPDPNATATFTASRLDWSARDGKAGQGWLTFYRGLLDLRRREIVPRLVGIGGFSGKIRAADDGIVAISWRLGDGALLHLSANFNPTSRRSGVPAEGRNILALPEEALTSLVRDGELPPHSLIAAIEDPGQETAVTA